MTCRTLASSWRVTAGVRVRTPPVAGPDGEGDAVACVASTAAGTEAVAVVPRAVQPAAAAMSAPTTAAVTAPLRRRVPEWVMG